MDTFLESRSPYLILGACAKLQYGEVGTLRVGGRAINNLPPHLTTPALGAVAGQQEPAINALQVPRHHPGGMDRHPEGSHLKSLFR